MQKSYRKSGVKIVRTLSLSEELADAITIPFVLITPTTLFHTLTQLHSLWRPQGAATIICKTLLIYLHHHANLLLLLPIIED